MRAFLKVYFVFVLLFSLSNAYGSSCKYDIEVSIESSGTEIYITTNLEYHHNGDTLSELVFQHSDSGQIVSVGNNSGQILQLAPTTYTATIDGEKCFIVKLKRPLKNGDSIDLILESKNHLQDRYGIKHLQGSWHPRLVLPTKGKLSSKKHIFADYCVKVYPVPQPSMPSSGEITNRSKRSGGWELKMEAKEIPDFGLVLSHSENIISETLDNITINCFYIKDKDVAERMINTAKDIISFYKKMYGFYPSHFLNIIAFDGNGFGGGPIGSNIVFVNKTFEQSEDNTIWAIAHEIAHQYWGWNWVRDANPQAPWICLGLGLWSDLQYIQDENIEGQHSNILNKYYEALSQGLSTRLENSSPGETQNRMNENLLSHSKGFMIMLMLESLVGKDIFHEISVKALSRLSKQVITTDIFKEICEEISSQELDWFFNQWVYTSHTLNYRIAEIKSTRREVGHQILVYIDNLGSAEMPIEVMMEDENGFVSYQQIKTKENHCEFISDGDWRRVAIDPKQYLPDTDRRNNVKINSKVKPALEILDIDLGDKAWGHNLMKVHVKNTTHQDRSLVIHIGGKVPNSIGFGKGDIYAIRHKEDIWIKHKYWVPPGHGSFDVRVLFKEPLVPSPPWHDAPFLEKVFGFNYQIPNNNCNELVNSYQKQQGAAKEKLKAFTYFKTKSFVIYCSPGTQAYNDIDKLIIKRERALQDICDVVGVEPSTPIILFFYPDKITKRKCTLHQGMGLARGNTISEVYNTEASIDHHHELTHIVMGEVGNPPALFNEGLAVYMQEDHFWHNQHVHEIAANLLNNNELPALSGLITRTEIGSKNADGRIAYPVSSSFVGFLIDCYGKDRFVKVYKNLVNSDEKRYVSVNSSVISNTYGLGLSELEVKWKVFLKKQIHSNKKEK